MSRSCPLWVKSRRRISARRCPLYPSSRLRPSALRYPLSCGEIGRRIAAGLGFIRDRLSRDVLLVAQRQQLALLDFKIGEDGFVLSAPKTGTGEPTLPIATAAAHVNEAEISHVRMRRQLKRTTVINRGID